MKYLIVVLLISHLAYAECPDDENQLGHLTQVSTDSLRAIKEVLASDIDSFCHNSTIRGNQLVSISRGGGFGINSDELADQTLDSGGESSAIDQLGLTPWQKSQYPTEKSRMAAFNCDYFMSGFKSVADFQKALRPNGLTDKQIKFFRTAGRKEPEDLAKTNGSNAEDVDKKVTGPIPYLACSTVTVIHAVSCGNGIRTIAEIMRPTKGDLTLVPELADILQNPKYHNGLIKAAQLMLSRVQTGGVPKSDYFHDIEDSYRSSGLNDKDAHEAAWKTVAVIATGGSNIGGRAIQLKLGDESAQAKIALQAMAVSSSVLDFRSEHTGHFYSYPPNVTSTCDTGTAYHFWMAAYLARKVAQSTGSTVGGAAASYTTEKGYEMIAKTGVRDPHRSLTVRSLDDFNNIQRMNMALSAAGAVYGANDAQGKTIQIDADGGLKELIRRAGNEPALTRTQSDALWGSSAGVGAFHRWQSIFAPDSAFSYYQNHL